MLQADVVRGHRAVASMRRSGSGGGVWPGAPLAALFPPEPPPGAPGDPGVFGPGSEVWRIGRERVLVLTGPAALLMQIAHPLVAAGVDEHSDFRVRPLHRLRATLDATLTMTFGDRDQAAGAAARIRSRHRRVTGCTDDAVGAFPAGTAYRADDPQLTLWVLATLVWTALDCYDGFVEPLPHERRARYQAEMSRIGTLLGVPRELPPGTYGDFTDYMASMDSAVLTVGPRARRLAVEILSASVRGLPRPLLHGASSLAGVLTAGLLPPRLRASYGLRWDWRERQAFRAACLASRTALPALPPPVRYWPHYLSAHRRVGRS